MECIRNQLWILLKTNLKMLLMTREKKYDNKQKTFVTDSNATKAKDNFEAKLYIEENLITVGGGILENVARQNVSIIAYKILKEMCFTLILKNDTQCQISLANVMNNSIEVLNSTRGHDKIIADNNIGCMMLKNMGWKEGDELGKNNQGVKSPIEIYWKNELEIKSSYSQQPFTVHNFDRRSGTVSRV
ncbi:NF-kappa-B-repressing factor-like [Aphis craccivora]|uniref:NF-kappa-B-repressing factor-like n=1 Tax=Aphis craccivora TaxID=307492 RepID=A0A6G0ZK97_APHCR|nr:NF-kappa-B-repressing factor-like [Aphis craccivora]